MADMRSRERLSQAHQVMDVVDRARQGADAVTDGEALRALVRTTYQEQGIDVDDALIESAVAQLLGKSDALPATLEPIPASAQSLAAPQGFRAWWQARRRERRAAVLAKASLPVVLTPEDEAHEALEVLRTHPLRTDAEIIVHLDALWQEAEMSRRWYGWKAWFWVAIAASGPICFIMVPILFKVGISHLFPWMASMLTMFMLPAGAMDAFSAKSRQNTRLGEITEARGAVSRLDYKGYNLNRLLNIKSGRMEPLPSDSVLWSIAKRGALAHDEVSAVWAAWLDSEKVIRDSDVWLLSETCDKLVAGKAWVLRKQLNEQGAASQAAIRTQLKGVLPSSPSKMRVTSSMEEARMAAKLAKETEASAEKEVEFRAFNIAKEHEAAALDKALREMLS